jgi:hypothetical protein
MTRLVAIGNDIDDGIIESGSEEIYIISEVHRSFIQRRLPPPPLGANVRRCPLLESSCVLATRFRFSL